LKLPINPILHIWDVSNWQEFIRVTIQDECIAAYNQLRLGKRTPKPKFIIYKISDDDTTIVLEESSPETDYEVFLKKLSSAVDKDGNPTPRYAVYDVEYDLGSEGNRYEQNTLE
jgi:cofilin